MRRSRLLGLAIGGSVTVVALTSAGAGFAGSNAPRPQARSDVYSVDQGQSLTVSARRGLLDNDRGVQTVVKASAASHGSFAVNADGSFVYTPAAGYVGPDSITYTATDAVELFTTHLPPLATIGGVAITGGAYGSSLDADPNSRDEYYGLTDRGPNVDIPDGNKMEPIPSFNPAIGKFRFVDGNAVLEKRIALKAADGSPYSGRVNGSAPTGETIEDINGNTLAQDPNGYDSEGLVAAKDGTFWVSDEYGPFITHFDRNGRQIGRLSPFGAGLPAELRYRVVNKGMEGLTITPDGKTLVGIMQNALGSPDLAVPKDAKDGTVVHIVTVNIASGETHEYPYLLASSKTGNSEITALSSTEFLVDERDGNFPPKADKKLYKISIAGATDIGPKAPGYDATRGRLIGGKSLEAATEEQTSAQAEATLKTAGITPVSKVLYLDLNALLTSLDPAGGFFDHDKVEGLTLTDGGRSLVLSNDNDFGIDGVVGTAKPYQLHAKIDPATGKQDDGEYLVIHLDRLPARTSSAIAAVDVLGTTP